jgi:hypothetical protein
LKKTDEYENPWTFNGKIFDTEDIGKFVGFVYVIECKIDGNLYIGRKYFYSRRKAKGAKRRTKKESDWKTYYGSSQYLKDLILEHGKGEFKRIILSLHITEGDCNYEEVRQQFINNVLEEDRFINENINGKWHRKPKHIIDGRVINEDYRISKYTKI